MKKLLKDLNEFTPERFNDHYRNLIDIAIPASIEYEMLHVLTFISDCQTAIDKVKEALQKLPDEPLVKQPGETHCVMCAAKEESIQALKKLNEELRKSYEEQRETVKISFNDKNEKKGELEGLKARMKNLFDLKQKAEENRNLDEWRTINKELKTVTRAVKKLEIDYSEGNNLKVCKK